MNAVVDHVVLVFQVLGVLAMGYGMVLSMMRKGHEMPAQASKGFARY